MTSVLCAGLATADLLLYVADLPARGEKYRATDTALTTGGGALNAAVAIVRLGGSAALLARAGRDAFGDMIASDLAREGVDARLLARDAGIRTPRSAVMIDAAGERMIVNHRDPDLLCVSPEPFEWRFGAALADTRWPAAAAAAMSAARAAGAPGILDAEAPVEPAGDALDLASHVAFSEQGLRDYGGTDDLRQALRMVTGRHGGWACVTRGPDPVIAHDGASFHEIPAFPVSARDTLGAGDVWHGAFALFLAEGRGEAEAARRANAAAALKCIRPGGRDGAPDRPALDAFLKEHDP